VATIKGLNIGMLWAAVSGTAGLCVWALTHFAAADDLKELEDKVFQADAEILLQMDYSAYYDRLDDYEETLEEGRDGLAAEYKRQMERIRARICEQDPQWERCDGDE
jgi:hypothetical protein